MERFKDLILKYVGVGRITNFSDCIYVAIGWYGALGDEFLPIELVEWFFELIHEGKIRG